MCLILIANKVHPKYKLVVAANRDEFYSRPTQPLQAWEEAPQVLAGRDLQAGGTWMGINREGKISMLTNYRDLSNLKPNAPSRGHLVSEFLLNGQGAKDYLKEVAAHGPIYNGFNLICGNMDELYYYGNYQEGIHLVPPGCHGLSNALLNTQWPKIKKGIYRLGEVLHTPILESEILFEVLYDDIKAPDHLLPDTGVGLEVESMLSPLFIKSPEYGSRSSTILLADYDGHIEMVERTYDIPKNTYTDKRFYFRIS